MVKLSHVYKSYGHKKHVFQNVNFEISENQFLFLTGHSGAGKTTLFRMIAGYEPPTSGKIEVNSYELDTIPTKKIPHFRRTIGVVYQDFRLLEDRTIAENVALPMEIMGLHRWQIEEDVSLILKKVGLAKRRREYPGYLSGGEKQRVAIARALVHRPPLLIADEPTGNLDKALSHEIMDLFQEAHDQGTTIIIATHDLEIIKSVPKAKKIIIQAGQLVEQEEEGKWDHSLEGFAETGLSIL